jgi:protein arginine kinase activator
MPLMCESCGKRVAKIHFTEVVNNQTTTVNLCLECAEKKGIDAKSAASFGLGDLVAEVWDSTADTQADKIGAVRCASCGFVYSDFRKIGRFGCPDCYRGFEPQLVAMLRKIHGSTQHQGKGPKQMGPKALIHKELMDLREELGRAVQKEEYEEAAAIRDRIKELEKQAEEA